MHSALQPGLTFHQSVLVNESLADSSLARLFVELADMPPVFTTAHMVGLVEWTCVEGLRPYLHEGEQTVSTLIDISHLAASPIGTHVTAEVSLLAVVGRKLRFSVRCSDEFETIGKGCHERTVVRLDRFIARSQRKIGQNEGLPIDARRGERRIVGVAT